MRSATQNSYDGVRREALPLTRHGTRFLRPKLRKVENQQNLVSKASPSCSEGSPSSVEGCTRRNAIWACGVFPMVASLCSPLNSLAAEGNASSVGSLRPLTSDERAAVDAVMGSIIAKTKAPGALRLVFHDCGTYSVMDGSGGSNASVQFELERRENAGLKRPWGFVVEARKKLQGTAAADLSYADLIALAGAAGIRVCGGPRYNVLVGRKDASGPDPEGRLPEESASVDTLKAVFARQGFSTREMIALSGAHTLGGKGFGDPAKFDNFYYQALLRKPWLNKFDSMASMIGLPSDHVLPDDPECLAAIEAFAADEALFQTEFQAAYLKLTTLGYA